MSTSNQATGVRPRVLVVEDSHQLRPVMFQALFVEGYGVVVCESAEEGHQKASEGKFDVFVVDNQLPGKNGIWLITQLRKMVANQGVPIIFWSASQLQQTYDNATAAGATASVRKHNGVAPLLAKVQMLCPILPTA